MGKKSGKAKDNVKKAQLLDPSCEHGLTDKFRIVLREVFERFDEDKDGGLSREELQNFAVAANAGSDLEDDEVEQLQQFFETNDKGHLTLKGFFQMYHMQTMARSSDTWKDMQRLGYLASLDREDGKPLPTGEAPPEKPALEQKPAVDQKVLMEELRTALSEMKVQPESAAAHRRVGNALQVRLAPPPLRTRRTETMATCARSLLLMCCCSHGPTCTPQALGRDEAAARSMQQADELEGKATAPAAVEQAVEAN